MTLEEFNALGITMMHWNSEFASLVMAAIRHMWLESLGVDVNIESQEWQVYLDTVRTTTPLADMPHIWLLGWCADYADESNWVHKVFNVDHGNNLRRGCVDDQCTEVVPSRFDDITEQALAEQDPSVRIELYFEAERILSEVEAAYIPLWHLAAVFLSKPWLTRDFPLLGASNIWEWEIDWEAKQAARN
jgi:oligopeptide transport system substrate-binding protein